MSDQENMGDNPVFAKNLDNVIQASQTFVKLAVTEATAGYNHGPARITMAIATMAGPLAALSLLISKDDSVNAEAILFSAILAAKAVSPVSQNEMALAMGPAIILEAMEAYEKLTGQKADDIICTGMSGAARHVEDESVIPLQKFMEAAAARKGKLN